MSQRMLHIAMVSCPGVGHIKPLLSLAEEMVKSHEDIIVTVFGILSEDQANKSPLSGGCERVNFHYFVDQFAGLPFDPRYNENAPQYVSDMVAYIDSHHLPSPLCHVYDMFAVWSTLLADTYKIPSYLFMPCSLRACVQLFSASPTGPHDPEESELERRMREEMKTLLTPEHTLFFKGLVDKWKSSTGMLVNDISELSTEALIEKVRTSCVQQSFAIYTIGPVGLESAIIDAQSIPDDNTKWLDKHLPNSVIYVALGSWCELPLQDLCELAFALRSLRMPVLWAYRGTDPNAKKEFWVSNRELTTEVEADGLPLNYRESVDPEEFRIVKWVDQRRILQHPSIRLFVSHCGWNSTIEALYLMGKPIAALPIGAEQGCNAIDIEVSLKVGKRLWDCSRGRKLDSNEVNVALTDILSEPMYLENAQRIRSLIKDARTPPQGSSVQNMEKFLGALLSETQMAA